MKFQQYLVDERKRLDERVTEALTVRSITDDVPRDFISKVRANQGLRNKINKDLHKIMKPTYFNSVPLKDIFNMLNKHGIVVLQDDQTEWSGFLLGGVKQTEQIVFRLGWKETKDQDKRYQVISNMALNLSYYKMPSGKYEVIAYVS
jgi:hypothetical protein